MAETIVVGLLLFIPIVVAGGGPFLLSPMPHGPKTKFTANFALIDLAALMWLVSLVPLLLLGIQAIASLVPGRTGGLLIRNFEHGYWFIATMLVLILVTMWASGVRYLVAQQIRNWKARASYLGLAIPLAYLCPACLLISLVLMILDRRLVGFWGTLLILFSLLMGVIARYICVLVMRTSDPLQSEPGNQLRGQEES